MNWKNKIIGITPFICLIAFFILSYYGLANPGWIVFLLIPTMPVILGKRRVSVSTIIIAIYLIVSVLLKDKWNITWVILFLIPIIHILIQPNEKNSRKRIRINDNDIKDIKDIKDIFDINIEDKTFKEDEKD